MDLHSQDIDFSDHSDMEEQVAGTPPATAPLQATQEVPKKKREAPAYHWCATLNNADHRRRIKDWFDDVCEDWPINYIVAQEEVGQGGTNHFQIYVEFSKAMRFSAIKKLLHGASEAHWEKRKGTPTQARDYCMKGEGPIYSYFVPERRWSMRHHPLCVLLHIFELDGFTAAVYRAHAEERFYSPEDDDVYEYDDESIDDLYVLARRLPLTGLDMHPTFIFGTALCYCAHCYMSREHKPHPLFPS